MSNIKLFSIVENEWREEYDREWGLGIVTSVPQPDGHVWVAKILKDDEGYFVAPEAAHRHESVLRETNYQLTDLPVRFDEKA